jgi:hypothetical protein
METAVVDPILTRFSVFYVSYIGEHYPTHLEAPSQAGCTVIIPGKAIPLYTIVFGILSIAMAFVKNFGASLAVRFLLGYVSFSCFVSFVVTESPISRAAEAGMLPGMSRSFAVAHSILTDSDGRYRYRLLSRSMVYEG